MNTEKTMAQLESALLQLLQTFKDDDIELGADEKYQRQIVRSAARRLAFGPAKGGIK